ncbi:CoA-dependent acyltransferase [Neocallimastix lanati (nom. inval.)]|jgi:chloramphenicol O-acetyltransferase type A|uniref:CoA-dependent acyltransferase n=1 Tax=Neocallimastix californiae TaxID=1754190 RepID=A0A1Y2D2F3_9FUNG|nr:CoA-dependent acyltransferase [Neocallimastix sp. JGI-2020a]ORY53377.1 CoA-dependent acyltransferase [Neocallimastix californiae]|eukprot:ORY53377.1 CoA-dependent acyltransferase [Neocallimastix californiae]
MEKTNDTENVNNSEKFYDTKTNSIKWIDIDNWERKELLNTYIKTDFPYIIITANICVTKPLQYAKKHGISFNRVMIYLCTKTIDQIPNYRYRFIDGKPFIIDHSRPIATHLFKPQNVLGMVECPWPCNNIIEFCQQSHFESSNNIITGERTSGKLDYISFTSIPWIEYTSFIRTISHNGTDNVPKISFGKYFKDKIEKDKIWMPVSSQTHHGLMDGYHVGLFYTNLQKACSELKI